MPKFSIIVPIYKIEEYLCQCVDSILNQQYKDFEVILVDDGSPDLCPQLCDEYSKKDTRVRVVHKVNGGLVSARETGVNAASGEYIGYVDGDDWIEPALLSTIATIVDKIDADIIHFNYFNYVEGKDKKHQPCKFMGFYDKQKMKEEIYSCMLCDLNAKFYTFGVIPAVWCKFYKRNLLLQNLCKNEKITFGEDVGCFYQAMLNAESIYFCNQYLYHYRRNRNSMTKAYNPQLFEQCAELLVYLQQTLLKNNEKIKVQFEMYKSFILFKCVLNEARVDEPYRKMEQRLNNNLKKYEWDTYIQNLDVSQYTFPYPILFRMLKKKQYIQLLVILDFLLKLYR